MKCYVIICLFLFIRVKADSIPTDYKEYKEKLVRFHQECLPVSGVDKDLMEKTIKGEYTGDPKLKEQIFCVSKKSGLQNDAGEFQKNVIIAKLDSFLKDKKAAEEIYEKCAVKKDTPQETAFEVLKCYFDSTPGHIGLV